MDPRTLGLLALAVMACDACKESAGPLDVFANAHVGDWQAHSAVSTSTVLGKPEPDDDIRGTRHSWVTAESRDTVTVTTLGRQRSPEGEEATRTWSVEFPRTRLTLEKLLGYDVSGFTLRDVSVTDEVHVVGGRTFACKKITFASRDPILHDKRTSTELWLSAEVPAGGLVAERKVERFNANWTRVTTTEVTGFGTATAATWGSRPDGL